MPTGNGTVVEKPAYADAPVNQTLTPEQKIEFLREMYRIRRFEQRAFKAYQQEQKMGGSCIFILGRNRWRWGRFRCWRRMTT